MKFRRALNTADTQDAVLTKGNEVTLLWAYGDPHWSYHGINQRGNQTLLLDETVEAVSTGAASLAYLYILVIGSLLINN